MAPSFAQETKVEADSLDHKGGVYVLTGSARVEREDAVVTARRIVYNEQTGDAQAEGDVYYEDPDVTVRAERAEINFNADTGVLYGAYIFIKKDEFHIYSPEARKTAKDRYFLKEATATTCDPPDPAWCITGDDVDIYVGERLIVRHATLRVRGVPVLYYPLVWAPIVAERRTGLLNPVLGYRDSMGVIYKQKFFWAVSENRDLTLGLDVYTERGLGESVEYRYVEAPGLRGEFSLYHTRDGSLDRDYAELTGRHRQSYGFLDVNFVNRREFYREYETYLDDTSPRFLESQAEAFAPFGTSRLYIAARYVQDLKDGVDQGTVPQSLPEAGFFLSPGRLGPVLVSGATAAANVETDEGADGQRYEAGLKATHSTGQGVTLSQAVGAREVYYDLEHLADGGEENFADTIYDYEAALRLLLERQYGGTRHELEPSLSYSYVARDGEEPTLFDSVEGVEEGSVAAVSVVNRLKDEKGELMKLKLSQGYDFEADEQPFTPMVLELALMRKPLTASATVSYSTEEGRLDSMTSKVKFGLWRTSVTASQTYNDTSNVKTYKLSASRRVAQRLFLKAGASYDDAEEKRFEELSMEAFYDTKCWGVAVSVVDTPEDIAVFLTVKLTGLGSYRSEVYAAEEEAAAE